MRFTASMPMGTWGKTHLPPASRHNPSCRQTTGQMEASQQMIESFRTGATGDEIDPISAAESIKAIIHVSYKVWIQRHAFSPAQIVDGTADDYTECTPDKPLPPVTLSSDWTFDRFKCEAVKSVNPWPPLDMGAMILELNRLGLILWHCHIEGSPTFGAGK